MLADSITGRVGRGMRREGIGCVQDAERGSVAGKGEGAQDETGEGPRARAYKIFVPGKDVDLHPKNYGRALQAP